MTEESTMPSIHVSDITPAAQPFRADCPSRDVLELVGGKWAMLIVCILKTGPIRTGALMRGIAGISQKMLTQTLRDLERNGIVVRVSHPEVPPRVEYRLSELGETLATLVVQIEHWVERHYAQITGAQRRFDGVEES
jgi:DNA-binding HxlR family transcriptional regulator